MNGASTTTGVAESLCRPVVRNSSHLSFDADHAERRSIDSGPGGALAYAEKALGEAVGSSGFVDVTASFEESFAACLQHHPAEMDPGNLDPGVLKELMSFVKSQIGADPKLALEVQARVPPEAAVKPLQ